MNFRFDILWDVAQQRSRASASCLPLAGAPIGWLAINDALSGARGLLRH